METIKIPNSTFTPKGDTEENWNRAINYIPKRKEIIIYEKDDNHKVARLKIGDGETYLKDLPFITDEERAAIEAWVQQQAEDFRSTLQEYVSESIEDLKKYNSQMKEDYIDPLEDRLTEAEGRVTIATFNITIENTLINLKNLEGITRIDWGDDEIVNSELSHTYKAIGEYKCKIYGCTGIGEDAFRWIDTLTSIVIDNGVTSIDKYAFANCTSLTSITFNGTIEEWKAISKASSWIYNVPAKEVVCTDGTTSL